MLPYQQNPYPPQNNPNPPPPSLNYPPQEENKPSNKGFLLPIALIIIVVGLLLGAGAYFINKNLNTPKKVRERIELVHPVVDEYTKSVKDLSEYLKTESKNSDTDSIEREVQKGKSLLKTSEDDLKNLTPMLEKLDIEEVQKYKTSISGYLPKAKAIIDMATESVELGSAYISPLKEMESINLSASGISNYMYSDPDKYVSLVNDFIQKMSAVTTRLEKITPGPSLKDYHEVIIRTYKQQIDLLTAVRNAVIKRSQAEITDAQKKYAESSQNQEKETNRVSDIVDEKINELVKEADSYKETITSEYNRLRGIYNF